MYHVAEELKGQETDFVEEEMSDEARGLTKWQLALVVGAGAAAVLGVSVLAYVAVRRSSSRPEEQPANSTPRSYPASRTAPEDGTPTSGGSSAPSDPKKVWCSALAPRGSL